MKCDPNLWKILVKESHSKVLLLWEVPSLYKCTDISFCSHIFPPPGSISLNERPSRDAEYLLGPEQEERAHTLGIMCKSSRTEAALSVSYVTSPRVCFCDFLFCIRSAFENKSHARNWQANFFGLLSSAL